MRPALASLVACTLLGACAGTPADSTPADEAPPGAHPDLRPFTREVSEVSLRRTVEGLVSFGTRHTLSDTASDTRGIGAARRWVAAEFETIGRACGGCLTVDTRGQVVTAPPRLPDPTAVVNVIAIQRGTSDPDRVVIVQGHLDSRVRDVMDFVSDAPGANDDASGVAAVIEAARVLSQHRFPATLVYAALTGEEQGLHGARILADHARAQGWRVAAVLNNDVIGNTESMDGRVVDDRVRVFSEGVRALESPAMAAARRATGGEVDSPSRNLARFIQTIAARHADGLEVTLVYRRDRFGRSGDHIPMLDAGFPAVRLSEAVEHYDRQHQDLRTEDSRAYGDTIDGVDFAYLAKVTRLNVAALAALAAAPPPPQEVTVTGAVSPDTTIAWSEVPGAAGYLVWWRDTTSPRWEHSRRAGTGETSLTLPGVAIDDWFFGVSSVSAEGHESPVRFAGIVGAVEPPPVD